MVGDWTRMAATPPGTMLEVRLQTEVIAFTRKTSGTQADLFKSGARAVIFCTFALPFIQNSSESAEYYSWGFTEEETKTEIK